MDGSPKEILDRVMTDDGLTDADVASLHGGNSTTVYRWRTGRTNLTAAKLRRLLIDLGHDPAEFGLPALRANESLADPRRLERLEAKIDALIQFHLTGDTSMLRSF